MTENMQWLSSLQRDVHGRVKDTLINLKTILLKDEGLQGLAFNTQTHRIMIKERMPWGTEDAYFSDRDEASMRVYIAERYGFDPSRKLSTVIMDVSCQRQFNPVKEYLQSLPPWDGVPRVDNLLVDYFAAEPNAYVKAVTRKTFVAAVARIKNPGIKFDHVLVLNGRQSIGKSYFFARLGGKWHSDSLCLNDLRDKTASEKLQGNWIVELAEMAGLSRADDDMLKAFITRTDDEYRDSYAKYCTSHKRQCILVGTTNKEDGFLKDVTGNRRYWPVKVYGTAARSPFAITDEEVEQIWAECLIYYQEGEPLYLDRELEEFANSQQQEALEQDSRAGLVRSYLEKQIPENWDSFSLEERKSWYEGTYFGTPFDEKPKLIQRSRVSNMEIYAECFGKAPGDLDNKQSLEITKIMRTIPGWIKGGKERSKVYGQQRIYERVAQA